MISYPRYWFERHFVLKCNVDSTTGVFKQVKMSNILQVGNSIERSSTWNDGLALDSSQSLAVHLYPKIFKGINWSQLFQVFVWGYGF